LGGSVWTKATPRATYAASDSSVVTAAGSRWSQPVIGRPRISIGVTPSWASRSVEVSGSTRSIAPPSLAAATAM
jgi:hypothetical protein